MSDILDDWFGFDPPPPVPEAKTPPKPAPTRKVKTSNVKVGVDETRKFTRSVSSGESKPERSTVIGGEDTEGIGINV